jgi:hypothetical protein
MNDEVNFCSQCGAKVSPGIKFCSNCGYDLQNSSAQTQLDKAIKTQTPLDKTIKIEVTNTNATVEKGFKAVGKVFKRKKNNVPKESTEADLLEAKLLDEIYYIENKERHPSKGNESGVITELIMSFLEVVKIVLIFVATGFAIFWVIKLLA